MFLVDFIRGNIWTLILLAIVSSAAYYMFGKGSDEDDDDEYFDGDEETKEYVDDGRPKLLILFGTQTGTSEDYSRQLESDAQLYGFNAIAVDMNQYAQPENLKEENLVVMLVSTYGEGEPPDGAKDFYDAIRHLSSDDLDLSNVKFSIFGFGNTQYKHYQAMSRFFDKKFEKLGAQRVFARGEGDTDTNLEESYEDWKTNLLQHLSQLFGTEIRNEKISPKYELNWITDTEASNTAAFFPPRGIPDQKHPYLSTVVVSKQLITQPSERSTVHVEFDIKNSGIVYEAGDHLAVYAQNEKTLIFKYASRLNVRDKMDTVFSFVPINDKSKGHHFPRKCSLYDAFAYFLDLTSLPRRKFIRAMSWYASDPAEKKELDLLASNTEEGKQFFRKFVKEPHRMCIDLLNKFKSVNMPVELFIELVPTMPPRYYSIASSKSLHPHSVHVVVSVVRYRTSLSKVREGVCSSYLERLKVGEKAYIYVRHSSFHLPLNSRKPIIMIGPGTGLAPLRGFWQQRQSLQQKGKELGQCHLFFGCRRKAEDWIYGEEMTSAQQSGAITQLHLAFSREQPEKVYVQHRLMQVKNEIYELLEKGAYIFICGDAKFMAKQVHDTLLQIIAECGGKNQHDTLKYMEKLETSGKYLKDVWASSV